MSPLSWLRRRLPVGTLSVLFGAHAFWLHPWFVAAAWWKLYGFPWDPRLWVAFFVHDLGYWGSPNMDGEEGERHPIWGANLMATWFDNLDGANPLAKAVAWTCNLVWWQRPFGYWSDFVLYHSRFLAKQRGARPSRLCIADKLAIVLTPWWIYRWTAGLAGEIREYRSVAAQRSEGDHERPDLSDRAWYVGMQRYMHRWVEEHRDGREDTWTPDAREARDATGVWS